MNKDELLLLAVSISETKGYDRLTRHGLAHAAGISYGTAFNWLGDMEQTKSSVMQHAVDTGNLRIIVDGIVSRHPIALAAPAALRAKAIASIG